MADIYAARSIYGGAASTRTGDNRLGFQQAMRWRSSSFGNYYLGAGLTI